MDLPRTPSQTSFNPSNAIHVLSNFRSRTPISRRLLSASNQEPQFAVIPSTSHFQPSCKREEARALQNLRRRVQALRLLQDNRPEPIEAVNASQNSPSFTNLDNRPQLLQKILSNKPVSMVLDESDIQTAWQDSDFITDCLCWHNVYRQRHSSPPLTMSSELCDLAQTWANHLAHTNKFYYRNDKDIGQNLFCRPANALQLDVTGQEVAVYWYSAVRQYHYNKEPDILHANVNSGHFTQLVWRNSKYFGIGKARSRTGKIVVVAHYAPAGNMTGLFQENVLPPGPDYPLVTTPRYFISSEVTESETSTSTSSASTQ
ncbi:hypothetical protein RN001_006590 [Aquatica leii]|uniref:SCP domain-containing protein n=1 Tax=Aquatica leii TaxID=1421715 RepID=A0AAN7PIR8_9COLE|nr:hypothetical protein RN001_006590 [Aquatica leii]